MLFNVAKQLIRSGHNFFAIPRWLALFGTIHRHRVRYPYSPGENLHYRVGTIFGADDVLNYNCIDPVGIAGSGRYNLRPNNPNKCVNGFHVHPLIVKISK